MENKAFLNRHIKIPAVIAVIGLLLVGGTYYVLEKWQGDLNRKMLQEKRQLDSMVQQVTFLREQYQLYLTYGDRYQTLIKEGLAKEQDRVLWTDTLLQERQKWVLNPMDIQFEAQKPIEKGRFSQLKIPSNIFFQTKVNLKFNAPSDLDVFRLLAEIDQKISKFFLVRSCKEVIVGEQLQQKSIQFNPLAPSINVSCQLILFNSKPKPFKLNDRGQMSMDDPMNVGGQP